MFFRSIFFLLVCIILPVQASAEQMNMQVIIYPPLAYEQDGILKGVAPEVVREIQAIVGDENVIHAAPWLRAYEQTQTEERQALFAIVRIPEREKLFKWVGPIFGEGDYFFKRAGNPAIVNNLEDARKVGRIAVRKGGYTHQTLVAKGFTNLDISPSYESSYKKLSEGRVDLVLMGELTYSFMVKKAGLEPGRFERTGFKFNDSGAWLAFSQDVPDETIAIWQKALDQLKANGKYGAIMKRNFKH